MSARSESFRRFTNPQKHDDQLLLFRSSRFSISSRGTCGFANLGHLELYILHYWVVTSDIFAPRRATIPKSERNCDDDVSLHCSSACNPNPSLFAASVFVQSLAESLRLPPPLGFVAATRGPALHNARALVREIVAPFQTYCLVQDEVACGLRARSNLRLLLGLLKPGTHVNPREGDFQEAERRKKHSRRDVFSQECVGRGARRCEGGSVAVRGGFHTYRGLRSRRRERVPTFGAYAQRILRRGGYPQPPPRY